MQKCF